jgi:CHAT domain-containing protein
MRVKLMFLLYMAWVPNFLPAQEVPESLTIPSALSNPKEPQERLARQIAGAQAALARIGGSAEAQPRETADATFALANLYLKAGEYEQASPLIERALEIRRTKFGDKDRDTAASFQQLAEFREELGGFAEAEKLYSDALAIRKLENSNSIETATTLHALGRLLSKMDKVREAEPLLREALTIREQKLSDQDVDTAYTLFELAKIAANNGNDSEARSFSAKAYNIFKAALGAKHPDTEDARMAMEAFGEVINEKMTGFGMGIRNIPGGPSSAASAGNTEDQSAKRQLFLSGPYNSKEAERLSNAAEVLERSYSEDDREQALLMQERSLKIRQRVLGPEHPDTLQSLQRLALAALVQGQYDKALIVARKAMFAQARLLQRIFSLTDEQQRLDFRATVKPFSVFASLPNVPARDLADAALRFKGAVLDSLIDDRRQAEASKDPSLRPVLARGANAREEWRRLEADAIAADKKDFAGLEFRRAALEIEFQNIEQDFARRGFGTGRLPASITASQVASSLKPDTLLVEIIRYPHHIDGTRTEDRYGAILLASAGDPLWVPLGLAADLEKLVANYHELVGSAGSDLNKSEELEAALRRLYDRLWLPIERVLPRSYRKVTISPDGALNFVSFATLLTADWQFLAEKIAISYVASGRDLVREQLTSAKTLVVGVAPYFNPLPTAKDQVTLAEQSPEPGRTESDAHQASTLRPLPATGREIEALRNIAARWGWEAMTLEGSNAVETRLREVHSPRVLHLATHGFFLLEEQVSGANDQLKNPMRRAGIALYGAEKTLDLWKKGMTPPTDDDGILTAEEASALDLKGTWMVSLPACETALGEAKAGEGVLGLRRGFIQGGVQNVLMTLWATDDEFTAQFMSDFYEAAHEKGSAAQALADVQRDWLVRIRKNKPAARAVYLAGPFVLSSQGSPQVSGGL